MYMNIECQEKKDIQHCVSFTLFLFKEYEWVIRDTFEKKISKFDDPENRFLCKHKTHILFFLFVDVHQMKFAPQFCGIYFSI